MRLDECAAGSACCSGRSAATRRRPPGRRARQASGHRLGLRQRLGLGTEKLERAALRRRDPATAGPLDLLPERADNAALYRWLAAFFAHADAAPSPSIRPAAGRSRCGCARPPEPPTERSQRGPACARFMSGSAGRCLQAQTQAPPVRPGSGGRGGGHQADRWRRQHRIPRCWPPSSDAAPARPVPGKRGYRPFLPVPLWGEVHRAARRDAAPAEGDEDGGAGAEGGWQAPQGVAPRRTTRPGATTR